MELVTTDDDGEIVVYECPDCGSQVETPVRGGELDDDQDFGARPDADEGESELTDPEDAA